MSVGFVSSDPLDNLTNLYQRPIFIQANRNPTVNDLQPPGTVWGNGATPNQTFYVSNGPGNWPQLVSAGGSLNTLNSVSAVAGNISLVDYNSLVGNGAVRITPAGGAGAGNIGLGVKVDGVTISIVGDQLVASSAGIAWADGAPGALLPNTGTFATAAGTYNLPAAPTVGQIIEVVNQSAGSIVVQASGAQKIQLGVDVGAAAGSATSTVSGDSISFVYRATNTRWIVNDSVGSWSIA